MKFSKDTSRLVEGRWYWRADPDGACVSRVMFEDYDHRPGGGYLWGDECPAPEVEVEPEPGLVYAGIKIHTDPSLPVDVLAIRSGNNERRFRVVDGILVEDGARAPAKPSPPAWVPPVCPAGQMYRDGDGNEWVQVGTMPLLDDESYPPPAWPPRIGEHMNVRHRDGWAHMPCQSAPLKDKDGRWYVVTPNGRVYQDEEGKTWRWVYRDLSGYVPPGGE